MEMKNPVRPGQLVKACLDVAEAAEGLQITRQQLHRVVAGHSRITPEMAASRKLSVVRRRHGSGCR